MEASLIIILKIYIRKTITRMKMNLFGAAVVAFMGSAIVNAVNLSIDTADLDGAYTFAEL